jgi:phage terminase small subunit
MTYRQQRFIEHYTDPESKTQGNATQSAIAAGYSDKGNNAAQAGHYLLSIPDIRLEIERILEENNAGRKVRLRQLGDIVAGRYIFETESTSYDSEGKVISTVRTKRPPSPTEIAKVSDQINKMQGVYDKNRADADAYGNELRELMKRERKQLKSSNQTNRAKHDTADTSIDDPSPQG